MQKTLYILLFALLPFLLPGQLLHNEQFKERASTGLDKMYNMKFGQAKAQFSQLQQEYPQHPGPHLLLASNYMWQICLNERYEGLDAGFRSHIDQALDLNHDLKGEEGYEVEYIFCEFMALTLETRLLAMRGNWAKCANTARKCLGPLQDGKDLRWEHKEFLFGSGAYDYYIEAFPEKHPIVKPFTLLFPDGDKREGIRQLEVASESETMTQGEAAYFLAHVYLNYEQNYPKALRVSEKVYRKFPGNSAFQLLYGKALFQNGKYLSAETELTKLRREFERASDFKTRAQRAPQKRVTSQLMIEGYYYLGLIEMIQHKDYNAALLDFYLSRKMADLADFEDHDAAVAALYHSGVCHDALGNRETALQIYDEVIDVDETGDYKPRAKQCKDLPCIQNF